MLNLFEKLCRRVQVAVGTVYINVSNTISFYVFQPAQESLVLITISSPKAHPRSLTMNLHCLHTLPIVVEWTKTRHTDYLMRGSRNFRQGVQTTVFQSSKTAV